MWVHYLQHVPFEGLGAIAGWLSAAGHCVSCTRWWAGETPPPPGRLDWLIVMGGPMGVYEEARYGWLRQEKRFIEEAIGAGTRVLGVCLGAQLIAAVLGARVYPNAYKEIGWLPIRRTEAAAGHPLGAVFPEEAVVFHWHGDTFDLPAGSIHLARSEACAHQAFAYGERVLALQFHLETTLAGAQELLRHCGEELIEAPYIQGREAILGQRASFAAIHELCWRLLERMQR